MFGKHRQIIIYGIISFFLYGARKDNRIVGIDSLNNVLFTLAQEFHWLPREMELMYFDKIDYNGLLFYFVPIYENMISQNKEIEAQKKEMERARKK